MIRPIAGGRHVAWVEVAVHEHVGQVDRLDAVRPRRRASRTSCPARCGCTSSHSSQHADRRPRRPGRQQGSRERSRLASGGEQVRLATGERPLDAGEVVERRRCSCSSAAIDPEPDRRATSSPRSASIATTPVTRPGSSRSRNAVTEGSLRNVLEHRLEPVAPVAACRRASPPRCPSGGTGRSAIGGGSPRSANDCSIQSQARGVPTRPRPGGAKRVGPGAPEAFVEPAAQALGSERARSTSSTLSAGDRRATRPVSAPRGRVQRARRGLPRDASGSTDSVWSMRQSTIGSSKPSVEASRCARRRRPSCRPRRSSSSIAGSCPVAVDDHRPRRVPRDHQPGDSSCSRVIRGQVVRRTTGSVLEVGGDRLDLVRRPDQDSRSHVAPRRTARRRRR